MTGFLTSRFTVHMSETTNPIEVSVAAADGDTVLLAAGIAIAGALIATILN